MTLSSLIERLEKAEGPDRELDLSIELFIRPQGKIADLMQYRRGFDGKDGMAWDIHHGGAVCFELYCDGRCNYNGGYPLPHYTSSIDAVLTLVPSTYEWDVGSGNQAYQEKPWCNVWPLEQPYPVDLEFYAEGATPAIAACVASLKATASLRARSAMTEEMSNG